MCKKKRRNKNRVLRVTKETRNDTVFEEEGRQTEAEAEEEEDNEGLSPLLGFWFKAQKERK
ncbi:hypothetical protein Csa_019365 [Cucumis sativus]|uniref:Uncharacterized protein n=1 Tax=Cucumis sativus TaxID=3659 RepID=A0A0A0LIE9_CUCSA|nr:hypothetical protein Csa_019365 [Cucumis sativus]